MKFLKGMDISTLKEVESLGGRFFDKGQEKDVLDILQSYGVNAVRLRLWNDPYTENGEPYGAGTNDLPTTIELTKRVLAKGMDVLLDFHYSDFWADPGKQQIPRAWQGMNLEELETAVYQYTKETLETMREADAFPTLVQIGNEVTNGILWPYGKVPEYDNLARLLNAGIRGARAVDQEIPLMIHLDNGGNNALYREWFDHFMEKGEEFQIIGLSYYPFWHGTLDDLANNMNDIAKRYGKELMVAEVSMGYTMEDYAAYEKLAPHERKGMATRPELTAKVPYPMTADNGYFMFYDASVFSEDDVKSLEKMIEVADAAGKKIAMDISNGWYIYAFFQGAGYELTLNDDGSNNCTWNAAGATDVAQAIMDLCATNVLVDMGDEEMATAIAEGTVVAAVNGTWRAETASDAWGENYAATKLPTFNVAGKDCQMSSYSGYKLIGVNPYSANVGWSMLLAEFLTNEAAQTARFEARGLGPANTAAAASDAVQADPAISALAAQAAYATPQRVGGNFWAPAETLGQILADGSAGDLQSALDTAVEGIMAPIE